MSADREASSRRRRGGGRAARQSATAVNLGPRAPYIQRKIPIYDILGDEGCEIIEHNADTILEEIGMEFRDDAETLQIFREAGCDVQGERVRFPRGFCRRTIQASAPRQFIQHARNPVNSVVIGGDNTLFAPTFGPPFVYDIERGRRYATKADFDNIVKLYSMLPSIHHSGGVVVEPVDVPVATRHLDMLYSHIRHSDKAFMGAMANGERAEDAVAMVKLLYGEDFVDDNCVLYSVSNVNAPLVMDAHMGGTLKVYARVNQAVVVSPFILSGAMSPVSVAGTLAQLLAEVLGGLTLSQLVRPGSPCVMGTFASAISMQSGSPTFGTPEGQKIILSAAKLARRLGVPFHSAGGGLTSSKIPDAQAIMEASPTVQTSLMAGANYIIHAAGCLEGLLTTGYEKIIMDADFCGALQVLAQGVDLSENEQALDAIREVGPGAHYLDCSHTMANYKTAFYRQQVADSNSFEQWSADGSEDTAKRAHKIWKQMLDDYQPPALDEGVDESLRAFMAWRKAQLSDRSE